LQISLEFEVAGLFNDALAAATHGACDHNSLQVGLARARMSAPACLARPLQKWCCCGWLWLVLLLSVPLLL